MDNSNLHNALQNVFLFSSLDDHSINLIANSATRIDINKGELLFSDGEDACAFFILINGMVKVYKLSNDGNEQILHVHQSGDVIAEGAIFDKQKYPANCIAIQQSSLIRIPKNTFVEMIMTNPSVALKIMASYSKRLRMFVSMIEDFTLKDIEQRLVKYLLKNRKKNGTAHFCDLRISKKELASLLGTVPETLSRALTGLKNKGHISESDKGIEINDLEKFRTLL